MYHCQLSEQLITHARLSLIKQADSPREETIKAHIMRLPSINNMKRSVLARKAAQAHVSRKSQRLIHERVTRCVTRC